MPSFSTAAVAAITAERDGLQRVDLDNGRRAYVLTQLIGPVAVGDRVVVNSTAMDLGLGTGGWDVVHWNLSRDGWSQAGGGHVLKLRYTSLQVDTGVAEEHEPERREDLGGTPVVVCDVHSQLAAVAVGFADAAAGRRLSYVMTDSAALPLVLSDMVAELRTRNLLCETITCGQAFGGDREAVSMPSALLLARGDVIVVAPGPGVVGTGTRLGFGSIEMAAVIDVAAALGGRAVVAVRYSGADSRPRHRGRSHHTDAVLGLASTQAAAPVPPDGWAGPVVPFPATTMGRAQAEDPDFFRYAAWAGTVAARLVSAEA
ncbi:MAG TPA: DUF3866 family protein [Acidimicrobiales bacterium]|nr:DUF3866 family protein [Acidimicrobiales bacterium]